MSSFGETLRAAREAKGLSCSQVAAQTHMLVQIVEEMEREDFHRIPAPIYGRGFVRLFADCVGLDPVPLVREFMDIYNGRRTPAPSIREVPADPTPPPPARPVWQPPSAPAPAPEPIPEPPTPESEPSAPEPISEPPTPAPEPIPEPPAPEPEPPAPEPAPQEPEPIPEPPAPEPTPEPPAPEPEPPAPEPIPEPQQVVRGLELFENPPARSATDDLPLFGPQTSPQADSAQSKLPPPIDFDSSPYIPSGDYSEGGPTATERFRKSLSAVSIGVLKTVRNIPRRAWRMTALLLCAILALLFITWSFSKLYQATSLPPETTPDAVPPVAVSPEAKPTPAKPAPAKPTPAPAEKKPAALPARPGKLISTGQNVPNLFID